MPTEAQALAREILSLTRTTLAAELRFLGAALCRLPWQPEPEAALATDGQTLFYGPGWLLRQWKAEPAAVLRGYLHLVLHCLYHHPFVGEEVALPVWDLACDIAAEATIDELDLPDLACPRPADGEETLAALRRALKGRLTAERIYRHYAGQALSSVQLEALRAPFRRDDHDLWYERRRKDTEKQAADGESQAQPGQPGGSRPNGQEHPGAKEQPGGGENPHTGPQREQGAPCPTPGQADRREQVKAQWEQLSAQTRTDLETSSRLWGSRAGTLLQNLNAATQKRVDYEDFLRRFAVWSETPQPDADSFDLLFYTYGLRLYGDMPLVEPLESREVRRIRSFVIVLDTSASIQREKAQRFLQRTCEVLLQSETFDTRLELHLLQCDAALQRDTVITHGSDLAALLRELPLAGGGGTDFRPAFAYIDGLLCRGALPELRGILYFTDGDGTYPALPPGPPDCKTAFVFADAADTGAQVPPWAIKVLLDPDTLDRPHILMLE